ncbi:M15 family metallopeptidase [uncultured Psychroserpens sp.]|uniref:M15 family metallopeptidase n=1 Tax=uncultured Psychroserpens sp. TaxID=255436 RepID=UPI00262BDDD1|nr:M15 family metallopeptidase [uncultured Psychroserpens sp.]
MNRQHFIKIASLAGVGISVFPQLAFQNSDTIIPYEELIGKGKPKLFGDSFKLRKEAYDAFLRLSADALKSDIRVQVVSSYRSFDHQNRIWERKYKNYIDRGLTSKESIKKIIEYSTIPGTSRHHWATDLDLIDANVSRPQNVLNPNHFENDGCFSKFKLWMDEYANDYGFYLVYTKKEGRKGFKYEPWHYSYKPLSKPYLDAYQKLNIRDIITSEQLMGYHNFSEVFISNYLNENILDINPELL